jgi:hypothetical protein
VAPKAPDELSIHFLSATARYRLAGSPVVEPEYVVLHEEASLLVGHQLKHLQILHDRNDS